MTTAPTQAKALILADALGQRASLFQPQPTDTLLADAASELQCLHVEIENLRAERDEADRRAGRAERHMATLNDAVRGHDAAFRRMKAQWGVHENVSFDVVWQQALNARAQPARAPLTDERIRQIDDATKFHESHNWSLRFARAVEADHGIKEPTNGQQT